MASAAPSLGEQPHEQTSGATPVTTIPVTDNQSGSNKSAPTPAESTQKPQDADAQAGHEDDEDSEFDELDGKHYLSTPPSLTTPHHPVLPFGITNLKPSQIQTS